MLKNCDVFLTIGLFKDLIWANTFNKKKKKKKKFEVYFAPWDD